MLKDADARSFTKIYLAVGYTDLRRGIDGLAAVITQQFHLEAFEKNVLFLFCGRRADRCKGLIWEGDGFLLVYKRLESGGRFRWPRSSEEAEELSPRQFEWLMDGLEIHQKHAIRDVRPTHTL